MAQVLIASGINKDLNAIEDNDIILDIGPKTIINIKDIIDQSNTVLWNGPAGYFENENFMTGTMSIAENISKNTVKKSLISILGVVIPLRQLIKVKTNFLLPTYQQQGEHF